MLLVKRHGDDAMLEAAERADQLLDEGDNGRRRDVAPDPQRDRALQAKTPSEEEKVH